MYNFVKAIPAMTFAYLWAMVLNNFCFILAFDSFQFFQIALCTKTFYKPPSSKIEIIKLILRN